MDEQVLLTEDRGRIRILTLNRPGQLNALDTPLTQALLDALEAADRDEGVGAIILTGAGRAFCAGADLSEFKDLTPDQSERVVRRADLTSRTQMAAQRLSKPVVSAVRGAAVGGGAGLAIGCDMMVAATNVKLGYPELKHSIVPALVMTGMQRAFGRKLAFELFSTGRLLSGEELFALGLANRLVAPEDVLDAALEIAEAWLGASPLAMAASKSLFYRVADMPVEQAMAAGRDVNALMRSFRK